MVRAEDTAIRITLKVTDGPYKGQEFGFDEHDTFIVGRGRNAHFRLPGKDPYFSRAHFLIEVNPPACRLTDLNSTNGTKLNDRRVGEMDLHNGDTIKGGDTTLLVGLEGDSPTERDTHLAVQLSTEPPGVTDAESEELFDEEDYLSGEREFAGYRLLRVIGRGGMGVVYLGEDPRTQRQVAIKMMVPGQAIPQRDIDLFLREANVLKQLNHAAIVACFDSGVIDQRFFLVTEFVPGQNLTDLLDESGPMPFPRALRIIRQTLAALDHAHRKGFVHRDVKPSNLIITSAQGADRAKLADFGLAKLYQSTSCSGLTLQGEMGGSFAFAAPEQITDFRAASPASDLYSVAATLYTMLTNCHVYDFPKTVSGIVLKLLHEDPVSIHDRHPDIPQALGQIIHRGLSRNPDQRFATAREMGDELKAFATASTS